MNHLSVDLETLGTRPGCVVLSIGAVAFDHRLGLGDEFYTTINQKSSEAAGLVTDKGTLGWWMRQSEAARDVLIATRDGGMPLVDALDQFAEYASKFGSEVRIWGCGASFDNTILSHLYHVTGKRQPWKYVNDRCYRTLKALMPTVCMERTGVHHNALADAKSQAAHAVRILARISEDRS